MGMELEIVSNSLDQQYSCSFVMWVPSCGERIWTLVSALQVLFEKVTSSEKGSHS
jgi:hypothetical protein